VFRFSFGALIFLIVFLTETLGWSSDYHVHIFPLAGGFAAEHLSEAVSPYRYTSLVQEVSVRWKPGVEVPVWLDRRDSGETERLLKLALDVWNSVAGVNLVYAGRKDLSFLSGDCGESAARRGSVPEGIYVTALSVPDTEACLDPDAAGVTHTYYSYTTDFYGTLREVFAPFSAVFIDPEALSYPFEIALGVFVHELGHALGLDHPFDHSESHTYSVMNYYEWQTTLPSLSDRDVLAHIYGAWPIRYSPPRLYLYRYADGAFSSFPGTTLCLLGGSPPVYTEGLRRTDFRDHLLCFEVQGETVRVTTSWRDSCTIASLHFYAEMDLCSASRSLVLASGEVRRWVPSQDVPEALFSVGNAGDDGHLAAGETVRLSLRVPPVNRQGALVAGVVLPSGEVYLYDGNGFVHYEGELVSVAQLSAGEGFVLDSILSLPADRLLPGQYVLFTYLTSGDSVSGSSYLLEWYTITVP